LGVKPLLAVLGLALLGAGCVAPSQSYWLPETQPVERLDYDSWAGLLRAHVRRGVVDYPAVASDGEFPAFLAVVRRARFTQDTTADQRLAFWINAYNASAIAGILNGQSPATLLGRAEFFRRTRYPVGGDAITLWDLEHERIQPIGDPRVYFALVCASVSCPALLSQPYLPGVLDAQLEAATRAFVNDPTKNRYDPVERVAHLSKIFEWHAEDFEATAGSVAAYVVVHLEDPEAAAGLADGSWKIRYQKYDWRLNGKPLRAE